MREVKKAVIPAAGLGTRFLPATKSVPKELLPIVDTPTIQYIVEEMHEAGVETVVLVTGKGKTGIVDHFDLNLELQAKLESEGKFDLARLLNEQSGLVNVVTTKTTKSTWTWSCSSLCKNIINDEPFVVALGDDLVDSEVPCTKQMIEVYKKYGKSVVALMEVSDEDISKFGVCAGKQLEDRVLDLTTMVEKPSLAEAPSRLAIVGRYILTPRIFEILEKQTPGKGGEIQLTDAMSQLMKEEGFIGYQFKGERYDAGDKFGFVQANIAYGLKNPEIKDKLMEYMGTLVKSSKK